MIRKRKGGNDAAPIEINSNITDDNVHPRIHFASRMSLMLLLGMLVALLLVFNQNPRTPGSLRFADEHLSSSSSMKGSINDHENMEYAQIHLDSIGNRTVADHDIQIFPTINQCWEHGPRDFKKHPVFILASYVSENTPQKVDRCDVPCFYSRNTELPEAPFADAYINFHIIGVFGASLQCPYAKAAQASMESPSLYQSEQLDPNRDYIAMTVELKSDVTVGYYSWVEHNPMAPVLPKTETALAATFISNCGGTSGRGEVLKELMNHGVTSDNYGSCFHNKDEPSGGKVDLLRRYKFGFAMENSIWKDYVTEKLFQVYAAGAVPIVVGAPNSHDYEPLPGSIIYDKDFPTIEAMAKHILYLASNDTAYKEYLRWKYEGPSDQFKALMDISAVHSRCRLCIKMADRHVEQYGDFHQPVSKTSKVDGEITFLIRERNTFFFRKIVMKERDLTIPSLYSTIFRAFHDRLPVWAIDRPASLNNNSWKIFRVYRYVGAAQTMHDTLFNDSILINTDEILRSLDHGTKLEVIFV